MPRGLSHRIRLCCAASLILAGVFFCTAGRVCGGVVRPVARQYRARIINAFPHDPDAFTQGFAFHGDRFYEGTGLHGRSTLRCIVPGSGEVIRSHDLGPEFFGEGITLIGDRIVQLTYLKGHGFVYDRETFDLLDEFTFSGQGWGLTSDGQRLIMSNGTAMLVFLDAETYEARGQVRAYDDAGPVGQLNELEFIDGEVWANVWGEDRIARIDPRSGRVTGWVDLEGLGGQRAAGDTEKVLNGIAWDAENRRLFVTGKCWSEVYEIEVCSPDSSGASGP